MPVITCDGPNRNILPHVPSQWEEKPNPPLTPWPPATQRMDEWTTGWLDGAVAGLLKRDSGKSHGIGLGDAIVAATAMAHKAALLTLNTKHYPMLSGLKMAHVEKQQSVVSRQ
ncbi:MAG: hypothetical protein LLG01_06740 [Planctomycetaceae bacterium]|nr:hypothetical protein [Planctomycetaceae bacterium]